jgi:pimeloyl-ACP methyl ester carboxylesterase
MPTFTHDGIHFHYQETGSGLPFFFQHGLGADVTQPFSLFNPPPGVRLIAFDARAHGQTRPLGEPAKLCFKTFGEDWLALLNHLAIHRAIVGGISMGAALALHFTLRWPERVTGLVLSRPAWLEAPCPWNVKMFTLVSGLIRKHGARQGLVEFHRTPEYRETLEKWPDVANSLSLQFQNPRADETALKLERIIKDTPHPERRAWASVRVPTLVLGNRLDPVHPFDYADELARAIPGAELREITSKSVSVERHNADVQRCLDEYLSRHFAMGGSSCLGRHGNASSLD